MHIRIPHRSVFRKFSNPKNAKNRIKGGHRRIHGDLGESLGCFREIQEDSGEFRGPMNISGVSRGRVSEELGDVSADLKDLEMFQAKFREFRGFSGYFEGSQEHSREYQGVTRAY